MKLEISTPIHPQLPLEQGTDQWFLSESVDGLNEALPDIAR